MAITLAQAKVGMANKVDIAVIDMLGRKSFLLDRLTFDDAVSPGTGGSTLTYGYLQLNTPSTAAVRNINSEYTATDAIKVQKTADCAIMGGSYELDRVIIGTAGALNELEFQIDQKTTATANLFHYLVINGVKANHKFDGLNVLLGSTENEFTSTVDVSTAALAKTNANALLDELDALVHSVEGGADVLLMNDKTLLKVRSVARAAGYYERKEDAFGRAVEYFGGVPMLDLGKYYNGSTTVDCIATNASTGKADIYAVRFGLDGFCGFSPVGNKLVNIYTPDLSQPGAVKKGEVELVAGVALKNTKAAAVLRGVKIQASAG